MRTSDITPRTYPARSRTTTAATPMMSQRPGACDGEIRSISAFKPATCCWFSATAAELARTPCSFSSTASVLRPTADSFRLMAAELAITPFSFARIAKELLRTACSFSPIALLLDSTVV